MNDNEFAVRVLSTAEADIAEIVNYMVEESPAAAEGLLDQFDRSLALLGKNPLLGRLARDEDLARCGYRYLIIGKYLLFYTVEKRALFVHRILHGSRDYLDLLRSD